MCLQLRNINIYNSEMVLFEDFSLDVDPGEILTIMGPSGCGKSTLLAFICGILHDNKDFKYSGEVLLYKKNITHLPIQKRMIGILFQEDLLFPHMNVEENLLFAIPSNISFKERKEKVTFFLQSAQLEKFENRNVESLSGGQRARINLLRTLLAEPQALLLDEPFSKLDVTLKKEIQTFIYDLIQQFNMPTILVTHNKEDLLNENNKIIYL